MLRSRRFLTWDEVDSLAHEVTRQFSSIGGLKLYGVPRGGIYAALAMLPHLTRARIVPDPSFADIIVDDIVDSGATKEAHKQHANGQFVALVDWSGPGIVEPRPWIVFPWESQAPSGVTEGVEENVKRILQFIGEDVEREGLKQTPARVSRAYQEMFCGYGMNPADVITTFEDSCDELVLLKDIEFVSYCEHHMLPFRGKAHIGYIPDGRVIGVSKLARILDLYCARLQIQERIGQQVTAALQEHLKPLASACVLEAQHQCMSCRGVRKQQSTMVTSSLTGAFRDNQRARSELFALISK